MDEKRKWIESKRGEIIKLCRQLTVDQVDTAISLALFYWDRRGINVEQRQSGDVVEYQVSYVQTDSCKDPALVRVGAAPLPAGGVELLIWPDPGKLHTRVIWAIYGELLRRHGRLLAQSPERTLPAGTKGKMREWRVKRAQIFRQIKDKDPGLSYAQVAMKANSDFTNELKAMGKYPAQDYTVRNDYEAMGWHWERSDRIR